MSKQNNRVNSLVIGLIALVYLANSKINPAECAKQKRSSSSGEEQTLASSYVENEEQSTAQQVQSRRKCVPLLSNLSLGGESTQQRAQGEFAFPINDIDMPLGVQQIGGNPLNSAMKLLSVFEKQIYGDDDETEAEEGAAGEEEEARKLNVIQFQQNKLHLSGLNLTMLNVHLYNQSEPKFGLGINVKNTTLFGRFRYNGPTPTLLASSSSLADTNEQQSSSNGRSRLSGIYRMSIDNVLVVASSNLSKVEVGSGKGQMKKFKLLTNDFRMNISNLGYISIDILDPYDPRKQTSSYVLRMLQRVLQKTIKRIYFSFENSLKQTLELEGRRFLDCELTRFEPILTYDEQAAPGKTQVSNGATSNENDVKASTSLEDLSRIISSEINNLNFSKVPLPDFDYQRQILGTNANIYFTNGTLTGLDNFRLTGETRVKLQNEHLLVNASPGWFNFRPHYNWTLYLGDAAQRVQAKADNSSHDKLTPVATTAKILSNPPGPSSSGFVAFNIKAIDFDAVISKGLVPNSKIVVDELEIRRLDGPKMEFGGLPGMNRLARGLVNFFMGRLKQRLVGSIQPALKRELEIVLNRLPILNRI